jgi:A/G-specific adenine glycosylase
VSSIPESREKKLCRSRAVAPARAPSRGAAESDATRLAPELEARLLDWYRRSRRDLPWRRNPDPYRIWVSEVLLQQTRVEAALPYYERFLERFPTVEDLAAAPLEDVLAAWSGLGYYRRARDLHAGARMVVEKHGGAFPRDPEKALEIPGVGPYTAAAVSSMAYDVPVPVVDGNVERVLTRLFRIRGNPRSAKVSGLLRHISSILMSQGGAGEHNQALMELGALVCLPARPACEACPVGPFCRGRALGDALSFPRKARKRKSTAVAFHVAVLRAGKRYLLEKISGRSFLQGMWLFPLVEAPSLRKAGSPRAEPSAALLSRLERKLGARLKARGFLGLVRHSITYRRITAQVFALEVEASTAGSAAWAKHPGDMRWVALAEMGTSVPVSSLALKIVRLIESGDQRAGKARSH